MPVDVMVPVTDPDIAELQLPVGLPRQAAVFADAFVICSCTRLPLGHLPIAALPIRKMFRVGARA